MAGQDPVWKQTMNAYWFADGMTDTERALLIMDMLTDPTKYDVPDEELEDFREHCDVLLSEITGL